MQWFKACPLLALQRSTPSRGTHMADPATCPSSTMASGFTTAPASGARTVTSGVQPLTTTARTSVGASVQWRVSSHRILQGRLPDAHCSLTDFSSPSLPVRHWLWDLLGYRPADRQLLPVQLPGYAVMEWSPDQLPAAGGRPAKHHQAAWADVHQW